MAIFAPHSTRGASTSEAAASKATLATIIRKAGKTQKTFSDSFTTGTKSCLDQIKDWTMIAHDYTLDALMRLYRYLVKVFIMCF